MLRQSSQLVAGSSSGWVCSIKRQTAGNMSSKPPALKEIGRDEAQTSLFPGAFISKLEGGNKLDSGNGVSVVL
ncbi:Hypothetical protein NocV09_02900910 [Nannochloropsis oceanica]